MYYLFLGQSCVHHVAWLQLSGRLLRSNVRCELTVQVLLLSLGGGVFGVFGVFWCAPLGFGEPRTACKQTNYELL